MLSNPSCKVCGCYLRDVIDKHLEAGESPSKVVLGLSARVSRTLSVYDEFETDYHKKRVLETLTESDIVEKNRLLAELDKKKALLEISWQEVDEHDKSHRKFSNDQRCSKPTFEDGDVIEGVDFTQAKPHTAFGGNALGVVFKNCNLTNCDIAVTSQAHDCVTRQVSFCSHLNAVLDLPECDKMCEHVSRYDKEVVVDGVVVLRDVIEYSDKEEVE